MTPPTKSSPRSELRSAHPNRLVDFTNSPGSNPGIEQNGGGHERPAILAWLRYFIYADAGTKASSTVLAARCAKPPGRPQAQELAGHVVVRSRKSLVTDYSISERAKRRIEEPSARLASM